MLGFVNWESLRKHWHNQYNISNERNLYISFVTALLAIITTAWPMMKTQDCDNARK